MRDRETVTGKRYFTMMSKREKMEALTFGLGDGGGGGDGAEGGAAWEGRVGPCHSHRVAHPRCRVNGSDRFICTGGEEIRKPILRPLRSRCFIDKGVKMREAVLTARQSEVALRRRVPALSHCEDDGPDKHQTNKKSS